MKAEPPPRRFWAPALGLVTLFGLLGPAVGGALAIPLAFAFTASSNAEVVSNIGWVAAAIGHAFILIPAYVFGLGPALGAGLVYALADSAAPERAPRALIAAAIGALFAYALVLALISLGNFVVTTIGEGWWDMASDWIGSPFAEDGGSAVTEAIVVSGAAAAFVCSLTASLLGLTTRARSLAT
ncbi:MAG: hypothetical protein WAL59_00985 [Roseiarcus sp.]